MKDGNFALSAFVALLGFALVVGVGITRGREREMYFHAEKQCREIRFAATADAARTIAARSGGTVQATPQGFIVHFERERRSDLACVAVIERDRVKSSDFQGSRD